MQYTVTRPDAPPPSRCLRAARVAYFLFLAVCAAMAFAGAAIYYNAASVTRIVGAYWAPLAAITLFAAIHAAWRPPAPVGDVEVASPTAADDDTPEDTRVRRTRCQRCLSGALCLDQMHTSVLRPPG